MGRIRRIIIATKHDTIYMDQNTKQKTSVIKRMFLSNYLVTSARINNLITMEVRWRDRFWIGLFVMLRHEPNQWAGVTIF